MFEPSSVPVAPPPAAAAPAAARRMAAAPLSSRERQVLELMARGQSNKLIARTLSLSPHTVKRHVTGVFTKLNLNRRSEAAAWYYLHPQSSGCCNPH